MRVLVVDDEKRLARALAFGLQAEGFAVDQAHEVEVRTARNSEWNIELDTQFQVLSTTLDN